MAPDTPVTPHPHPTRDRQRHSDTSADIQWRDSACTSDQSAVAVLVTSLEQALAAARRLRDLLEAAPCACHRTWQPLVRLETHHSSVDAMGHVAAPTAHQCPSVNQGTANYLSRREAQVLALLAAGRSNRQIAAQLCLSSRTVQRHVANTYLKIGAHNRAQATAYALAHHLA